MLNAHDFKRSVLGPLLRGERPSGDFPATLFAAELNTPLDYLFESDHWNEVFGAGKRLMRAGDKLRAALAADGYSAQELLCVTPSGLLTLAPDPATAARWTEQIERAVAQETEIVTVSTIAQPCDTQQILAGCTARRVP